MAKKGKMLSLYLVTFNAGRAPIDIDSFAAGLFGGHSSAHNLPDILVLSLQEVAPVAQSFVGGWALSPYYKNFSQAVYKATKELVGDDVKDFDEEFAYKALTVQNVGMIALMIFVKPHLAPLVKNLEVGGVGLGVANMGNKAAVAVRFKLSGENPSSDLTFISAHLAAFEWGLTQRNDMWKEIVRRLVFSSSAQGKTKTSFQDEDFEPLLSLDPRDATIYKPDSYLFVAGDLNYRTSVLKPGPLDYEENFPQPGAAKSSSKNWKKLLEDDQLNQERLAGRTLHGLNESPITFPPTYKYDIDQPIDDEEWHWAPHRWPSWCDRILYRPDPTVHSYSALPLMQTSDHQPVALSLSVPFTIPSSTSDDFQAPCDIDIDWRRKQIQGRTYELISGYFTLLTTTFAGVALIAAVVVGTIGLWWGLTS